MAKPSEIIATNFPFTPTAGQKQLFNLFDDFLLNKRKEQDVILIKGYAGTGKTSVVSALVKALPYFSKKHVLLAPTGRAAKVMSMYAQRSAFTIHKKIYKQMADPASGSLVFQKVKNYYKNTVFIVDEASMLSDQGFNGKESILEDLISYVFEESSNKMILIGDTAQLPPVGQADSPSLDPRYMASKYFLTVNECMLTEVMRQEEESGILFNATNLRDLLKKEVFKIKFKIAGYPDMFSMTGEKLEDGLRYAYNKYGIEDTIIICRSNKSAVQYNQYIRRTIHFYEQEIEAGDILMIVKNNYFYSPDEIASGFLANGDFVEVMKVVNFEDLYGLRFATLSLRLIDYPDSELFDAKVMLDTLHTATSSLPDDLVKDLYNQVGKDYEDETPKIQREMLKKDPYINALQIKYAYALTCHKSQGGQWKAVFVDQGFLKEDMIDKEYVRWLYTAITRATDVLFLVNFSGKFF